MAAVLTGCARRGPGVIAPADRPAAAPGAVPTPSLRPTPAVMSDPAPVAPAATPPAVAVVAEPRAPSPASATQREILLASPEDPEPEIRGGIVKALEDVSYIVGNEWSLDAFRPAIAELGGGYVGVGPDQA